MQQLKTEGRSFTLANNDIQAELSKLKADVVKLQQQISKNSPNFWDYEQIKEKWQEEFKKEVLAEVKANGLEIGSRWKIQQETTAFVIRDVEGSKTNDSRVAFPANSYLDPK